MPENYKVVEHPTLGILEFPQGMDDAAIVAAIKKAEGGTAAQPRQQAPPLIQGPTREQAGLVPPLLQGPTREQLGVESKYDPQGNPIVPQRPGFLGTILKDIGVDALKTGEYLNRAFDTVLSTFPYASNYEQFDPVTGDTVFGGPAKMGFGRSSVPREHLRANAEVLSSAANMIDSHAPRVEDVSSFEDAMRVVSKATFGQAAHMTAAIATGGLSTIPASIGEQQANLEEKGVPNDSIALVAGLGVAGLEAITPRYVKDWIVGKATGRAAAETAEAVAPTFLGRVGQGVFGGAKRELPTELGQEVIGMAGESAAGAPPSWGEAGSRLLNAGVGALIGGAAFGGAGAALYQERDIAPPPPPDPQVDQIINPTAPPPPGAPTQTDLFPLEEPGGEEEVTTEAPAAAPGQVPTPAPVSVPFETSVLAPERDLETYGDFTKDFKEETIGTVKAWRGTERSTVIAETQDGRYQLSAQPTRTGETQSWTFPSFEQAAWVATNIPNMKLREVQQLKNMPEDEVYNFVYKHAKPQQAVLKWASGNPIIVNNVDETLRHRDVKPLTYAQIDRLRSSPRMMQVLDAMTEITNIFRSATAKQGLNLTSDVGFLFSPEGKHYGYNQVGMRKIAINLGTDVLQTYPPIGTATSLVNTIIHEFAHDTARGHRQDFMQAQGRITGALLHKYDEAVVALSAYLMEAYATPYNGAIQSLTELLRDPTAPERIDPRILKTLRELGHRPGEVVTREGDVGQSFEELISGESQEQVDARGGDLNAVDTRPVVTEFGETLAQPIWFSRLGNALFGPTGIFGDAKQLSVEQLSAIANNPERYGVRPDEVKWTGLKVWLDGLREQGQKKISREEAENWFERHQVRAEEKLLGQDTKLYSDMVVVLANKLARNEITEDFYFKELARLREQSTIGYAPAKFSDYTSPGPQSNYSELLMIWNGAEYATPHFGANEIVHARFNVRDTPQGKVLFIEEVQSDWHQKGREVGYKGEPGREFGAPPQAPFANSWHELALKRLIRWAVDHGLDGIAWTPSKMQVERYESQARALVQSISWIKIPKTVKEGDPESYTKSINKYVTVRTTQDRLIELVVYPNGEVGGLNDFAGKNLAEVLGAETARKILGEEEGSIQGQNLTIGGEQYRILYDQEIPKFLQKYLKQWGIGLGRTEITVDDLYEDPAAENLDPAPNAPETVPFFPLNSSIRDSVRKGQPLLRELPPESRVLGMHVEQGAEALSLREDPVDAENLEAAHGDLDNYGRWSKWISTLLQLGFRNPHIKQLQSFIEHLRELVAEKNNWKYEGDKVLKNWNRLGKAQMSALSNFLFDVTADSDKFGRRLTLEELSALAKKHNLGEDAERVYHQIDSTFRSVLTALKETEMERVKQRIGPQNIDTWMIEQGKIEKEFEKILNRNYFPYARFGNHVVLVKATKDITFKGRKYRAGHTVHMSTYASRREMLEMEQLAKKEFAMDGLQVGNRKLPDEVFAFQGFPAHMYQEMVKSLGLNAEQADTAKRFFLNLSPSQSFIQHLRKRRGIAGFSNDAQRVFSHYLSSAAGHVARSKHMDKLKIDVAELKKSAEQAYKETGQGNLRDQIAEHVEKVLKTVENPGSDLALLRGLIFSHYFAFVPVQAFVNTLQLPMLTYPHLLMKYGTAKAATAMAKAMAKVSSGFNFNGTAKWSNWNLDGNPNLSADEKKAIEKGIRAGFINESFAVEVASLANGSVLEEMLPHYLRDKAGVNNIREASRIVRDIIDLGVAPFRMSEEWNRRVAFLAAYNLEREASQNEELAFKEGQDTIDQTMFEYASFNRPMIARALNNKAGMFLIFKAFQQHSLWYYMYGRGRMPALLALALFAGLEGLPLVEDINEILTTVFSWTVKNKRIDPKKIMRSALSNIMDDTDLVMHGLARQTMGLGYIPHMPGWDLSPKLGMGRVVPGIAPAAQAMRGEKKGTDAIAKIMEEWIGVAGSMGMNSIRAAVDFSPQSARWRQQFLPASIRNILRTQQALDAEAYVDAQGQPLVRFDQTDPTQLVEVLGQALGLRPTRLAVEQEVLYRASQEDAFFLARKEHMMSQLESALLASKKDPEAVAEAKRALQQFQKTMPPGYRFKSMSDLVQALKTRAKNNTLRERGLPTQARWRQLVQEYRAMYPSQK